VTQKRTGFTFGKPMIVLGVIAFVAALLAAVLFPVFAKADRRPTVIVLDALGRPTPGVTLHFRDHSGRVAATLNTGPDGECHASGLRTLFRDPVDGLLFTRYLPSTGSGGFYYFSPAGTQTAVFQDAVGHVVGGFGVTLTLEPRSWQTANRPEQITQTIPENGQMPIAGVPLAARFVFESSDPQYVVIDVQTLAGPTAVHYVVTVTRPATLIGSLSAGGKPLRGRTVFAAHAPKDGVDDRQFHSGVVGPTGRFRISGLSPGEYYVSTDRPFSSSSTAPMQSVTVADGQTIRVNLHAVASPVHTLSRSTPQRYEQADTRRRSRQTTADSSADVDRGL
jgi:hypothetical protein